MSVFLPSLDVCACLLSGFVKATNKFRVLHWRNCTVFSSMRQFPSMPQSKVFPSCIPESWVTSGFHSSQKWQQASLHINIQSAREECTPANPLFERKPERLLFQAACQIRPSGTQCKKEPSSSNFLGQLTINAGITWLPQLVFYRLFIRPIKTGNPLC